VQTGRAMRLEFSAPLSQILISNFLIKLPKRGAC
jgi:hypothetical protein